MMDSKENIKDSNEQQILAPASFNNGRKSCKKPEQQKPKPKLNCT